MAVVFVSFFCLYYLMVISLVIGWERSLRKGSTAPASVQATRIAVIVPSRNEEASIGFLLEDLRRQDYENFEIIVIDDHSTDKTRQVTADAARLDRRITILPNTGTGKKPALT